MVHHIVDNNAATSAELVGSCNVAAAEEKSCGAPTAVTSLAACRTSGDLQAGRSYVERATHGDTRVLNPHMIIRATKSPHATLFAAIL